MLWRGRSLALIQIMFQSLLEDLKPYPGSLEDLGNEACWDFNHFYICWKIRRKEKREKTEKKEKSTTPPSSLPTTPPSPSYPVEKNNNLFWGLIMKKKNIKGSFFSSSTFVFWKFAGLEISQHSTSMLKTPPTISKALFSPSPHCKINKSFWY